MKRREKYIVIVSLLALYILAMFIGIEYVEFRRAQVSQYYYYVLLASVIVAPLASLSITFVCGRLWHYLALMVPLFIVAFNAFDAFNAVSTEPGFRSSTQCLRTFSPSC